MLWKWNENSELGSSRMENLDNDIRTRKLKIRTWYTITTTDTTTILLSIM